MKKNVCVRMMVGLLAVALLASAMAMTLAACGGGGASTATTSAATATAAADEAATTAAATTAAGGSAETDGGAAEDAATTTATAAAAQSGGDGIEPVTIDVFMPSAAENPMTAGIQDDPVSQYIKEQTGVTINVVLSDSDKMNAMAASGDLYDLTLMSIANVTPLIQAGAVAALDDYLDMIPSLTEGFPGLVNYSREFLSNGDGHVYALCFRAKSEAAPLATSRYGTFIRWEWYKEAGSPKIASLDDLLDCLAAIQANHPTTEDGKKTYVLSAFDEWGVGWMLSNPIIWKQYAQYSINEMATFSIEDLSYIDLYDPEHFFWLAADLYFKANQQGILDPECYTQKWEDYSAKVASGQVIFAAAEWDIDAINAELAANGVNDKYVDVMWEDVPEVPTWVNRASEFGMSARTYIVSSKCDDAKLKGIARLLNFLFSEEGTRTVFNGPQGVTWDYDASGKAVFTDDCKAKLADNPNYLVEQGAYRYYGITARDYDALADSAANEGEFIDLKLSPEFVAQSLTETDKDYCAYYGVDVPLEAATKRKNQSTIHEGYLNLMPAENPTSIDRAKTQITDYLKQEVPAMVLSATREEYEAKFAEIQEGLKGMGYDDVTAYFESAWQDAIAKYNELNG